MVVVLPAAADALPGTVRVSAVSRGAGRGFGVGYRAPLGRLVDVELWEAASSGSGGGAPEHGAMLRAKIWW